ncbi:hypothetical protein XAP3CFBP6996_009065 [Xanthomonas citri pv. fuscans CFBP 6996]|uniref:beta family protein n=1 Tax=Xanthomonas citri TaxID=346 RepID=UPI000C191685|nr:beta family protein [Xanthomonas citri]ATS51385.1 beta family protein [Xanthomonas citri pv. phaseoli var. fuscans]ATS57115.1 beta family protein [Xanthomonas citri pv. phaseoli var. fuscans]ATS58881.1 beta family protein [Xanthomonas citri pv. phaseoli var. fuscans]PTY32039.1 hypothetical protein XAP3CFBP6996_009065 [Xanthomonas citri pv. fuscans CFBP 6996]QWN15991.1 hypothetical protein DGN02_09160 [Xanthomonas citri]
MQVTYTPFYHAKDGEFTALSHAKSQHLNGVLPLFEIGPFTEKMAGLVRYKNEPAPKIAYLDWVANWINQVLPERPVMVDTFAWQLDLRTETNEVPVIYAMNSLLERGLSVIPVVGVDRWADEDYQFALKALDSTDFPAWALRLQIDEIEDAIDPDHFLESIEEIMMGLGLPPTQVGLLMDFGDVSKSDNQTMIDSASRVLDLLQDQSFRFFSLVGCSMPAMVTDAVKKPNTEAVVKRREMTAWRALREKYKHLPVVLGDYGIRGPSSSDVQNPHINGKIRHTFEGGYFVARGQSKIKDDGKQMYRLAQTVASSPYFQGPSFSWGDQQLYRRAMQEKKVGPGGSNCWIKFDTSHHLAWVVQELATVEHALSAVPAVV